MAKLVVGTFLTLDGVMQGPGGPGEDDSGGFKHGGWSFGYWDEGMGEVMGGQMSKLGSLLLGRKTYEIFAAHWPTSGDETGALFTKVPKYVASKTLTKVDWENSHILKGDVAEEVAKLKAQPGDEIQVHGSGNLIQTLLANNLVDEFRLWVFPVVLGTGKRLFANGAVPAGLKLVDTKTSSTGVTMSRYQPDGAIKYGSFALE